MRKEDAKMYIALGSAYTIFIMMLLNSFRNPTAPNDASVYLLLGILSATLGLNLFRGGSEGQTQSETKQPPTDRNK